MDKIAIHELANKSYLQFKSISSKGGFNPLVKLSCKIISHFLNFSKII